MVDLDAIKRGERNQNKQAPKYRSRRLTADDNKDDRDYLDETAPPAQKISTSRKPNKSKRPKPKKANPKNLQLGESAPKGSKPKTGTKRETEYMDDVEESSRPSKRSKATPPPQSSNQSPQPSFSMPHDKDMSSTAIPPTVDRLAGNNSSSSTPLSRARSSISPSPELGSAPKMSISANNEGEVENSQGFERAEQISTAHSQSLDDETPMTTEDKPKMAIESTQEEDAVASTLVSPGEERPGATRAGTMSTDANEAMREDNQEPSPGPSQVVISHDSNNTSPAESHPNKSPKLGQEVQPRTPESLPDRKVSPGERPLTIGGPALTADHEKALDTHSADGAPEQSKIEDNSNDREASKAVPKTKRKNQNPLRSKSRAIVPKKSAALAQSKIIAASNAQVQRTRSKKSQPSVPGSSAKKAVSQKLNPKKSPPQKLKAVTGARRRKALMACLSLPVLPQPEARQVILSNKLTKREPLGSKPMPRGEPEVWAESRQALCETVPYFKRPQGGCYSNDGHVYGFLFDSVGHCREYLDENVIISRAGGGMESDGDGNIAQKKDQRMDESQVQAVLNDIEHHNPVVVVCGNRNVAARCKMPHQYCVLGWYKPIQVWAEKTAGKGNKVYTTIKYRFDRLNRHKPAWHSPKGPSEDFQISDEDRKVAGPLVHDTCKSCNTTFPQIYLRAWMCLNAACNRFWKISGMEAPYGTEKLEYNPAFLLHESDPWKDEGDKDEPEPAPLRPALPNIGDAIGDNLAYINTRGICCPKCGRCNPRRLFRGWICENQTCDFTLFPEYRTVMPAMLHKPWDSAPTLVRNEHKPGVQLKVEHKYGYKVSTYTFEGVKGCFIHAAATKLVVQEKRGPDDMFQAIQKEDMGLERRTFAVKKVGGDKDVQKALEDGQVAPAPLSAPSEEEGVLASNSQEQQKEEETQDKKIEFAEGDLMTAFSINYGMPYKFVASGASRPFHAANGYDEAPWPVTATRSRLNWAARAFLNNPAEDLDFNEELIFAYMEGQKIEYHDDGEEGLGPRIATASLGGRAKMHLRIKGKHYVGCSKTGIFTEERPIPGSIDGHEMYLKRVEKWEALQQVKQDTTAYQKRRKEIPHELGIFHKRMKKAEDLVSITLSHGDIAIMDGYDIQKYMEHKVVPEGHLRFALTCRSVLENHLKPDKLPAYPVETDPGFYDGAKVRCG